MANLLASIFGGGSQVAPQLPTYNPETASTQFDAQDFSKAAGSANLLTNLTSTGNLATNMQGLNTLDPGAITGLQNEQALGNSLMSGTSGQLPAWARTYMNNASMQGSESAIGRGVGAFSDNAISGTNQFVGRNALDLVKFGTSLTNDASGQAQGIVNANMDRVNPMDGLLSAAQFQQAGEFNTQIGDQQATDNAAVTNYNNNNSPLGSAIRTGMQDLVYLAGSFLGSAGKGMAM